MAEYIEREQALQIIDNYEKTVSDDALVVVEAIKDIVGAICPAADVQEVRRGYWFTDYARQPQSVCSNCNLSNGYNRTKYCPHCGARMDGRKG